MVGIVFVSHSAKIAEGVQDLANQMVQGNVPMAVAGGIDDPENPIGTDAIKVFEAIESVYSAEGVVVLMDLGSALLSAETALELLEADKRANVILSPAPFVEGALAAAIQAFVGGTREQVLEEARGSLAMKREQLFQTIGEIPPIGTPKKEVPEADWQVIMLQVNNRLGLHARPAAKFVTLANKFNSEIRVTKNQKSANAKSINQVALLGVRQGEEIQIAASGNDAAQVLAELKALVDDNFGESDQGALAPVVEQPKQAVHEDGILGGIAASPGMAVGPAFLYRPQLPQIVEREIADPQKEWQRLEQAIQGALHEIRTAQELAKRQIGAEEAGIFQAHALFLQDPQLVESVKDRIFSQHVNAEAAWEKEISATASRYRSLEDSYMQARAADIEDVGKRVLRQLMGVEMPALVMEQPSILIAADLSPSDTARLDPNQVSGICTELGGATSHSAILARALGIPAIVGLGPDLWKITNGQYIALNGDQGKLWPQPDEALLQDLREKRDAWKLAQEKAKKSGLEPAVTRDGKYLEIVANIGGPNDVQIALEFGAEGVGLFRTEFLYMDRDQLPSEEEQFAAYKLAAEAMGERPVIIRTLDVGGDKPLPYIDLGEEENPFLGWRGIRFCLDQPELFKTQLRAILRAGSVGNVKIMFPMISSVGEIRDAKAVLSQASNELYQEGVPFTQKIEIGIMIEVPSAVATADLMAAEVDFFSIGTNDLTQYTMAADRGNSNVAKLAQALQPAVLRMVKQTVDAAHSAGIWVGMCGELAGSALAVPVLVGLGLDELSMSGPAIPKVKEAIRNLSEAEAKKVAKEALALDSVTAVINYLESLNN